MANLQTRQAHFLIRAGRRQSGNLIFESGPGVPSTEIVGASKDVSRQLLESDTGKLVYVDTSAGGPGTGTIGDPYNTWDLARADIDGTTKTTIQVQDDGAVLDQEIFDAPTQAVQGAIIQMKNSGAAAFTTAAGTAATLSPSSSAFINGQILSAGIDSTSADHLERSTDLGATFSAVDLTGSSFTLTTAIVQGVIYDGADYILYGGSDSVTGDISKTSDLSGSPSYTNVTIGIMTNVIDLIFSNGVYVAVGHDGTDGLIYSSTDATTWTLRSTEATNTLYSVATDGGLFVAVGDGNTITTSPDGVTWTAATSPVSSGTDFDEVAYDAGYFYAVGEDTTAHRLVRSADGLTWADISSNVSLPASAGYRMAAGNGRVIIVLGTANYYVSDDSGSSWSTVAAPFPVSSGIDYSNGLFLNTRAAAASTFLAYGAFNLTTGPVCGIDFSDQTENTSISGNALNCTFDASSTYLYDTVSFSNNQQTDGTVQTGLNTVAITAKYNQAKTMSLRAPLVTDTESDHDGATTLEGPSVMPSFSFYRGLFSLTSNVVDMHDNVIAGAVGVTGWVLTGTPAADEDINVWNNTIHCDTTLNISGTGSNMRFVDNITEGNITNTDAATLISTGNHRGDLTGGVSKASGVTSSNPFFSDTTTTSAEAFQLQYAVNGYAFDSPLVNASVFSNTVTSGQARALGAWNFDNSSVTTAYSLSKKFPLASTSNNGNAFEITKVSTFANLQTGLDGTPDVFNDPNRRQIKVTLNYATIAKEFIDFIETIESQYTDMTCELDLNPTVNKSTFPVSVVANGAQAAGTPTVAVTTAGTIRSGMQATIGGRKYTVMYPVPLSGAATTSIVLDRVTETDIADLDVITITDFSFAEYQLVVPQSRKLTRPIEFFEDLENGLQLEFIKKA